MTDMTLEGRVAQAICRYAEEPPEEAPRILREIVALCRDVRPLVWPEECQKGQRVFGEGGLTRYAIAHYGEPYIYRWAAVESSWSEPFDTYEAAKAAAEAHHAERVRGMLR